MDSLFLNSYTSLEEFGCFLEKHLTPYLVDTFQRSEIEKLIILMGVLSLGKESIEFLDETYASDYFKNALRITEYPAEPLEKWLENESACALITSVKSFNHINTNPSAQSIQLFNFFEKGRLSELLSPIFGFVYHYLTESKRLADNKAEPFKKIPFSKEMQESFEKNGYLVIKDFLTPQQVETLKEITNKLAVHERTQHAAYIYGKNNTLQRVYNLLNKHSIYRDLLSSSTVVGILEKVFDRPTLHHKYYLSSFQANILNPGSEAQPLHVDSSVPDPLPPWIIRLNVNFLIDDFTETNGATLAVPGSHKNLRRPKKDDDVEPVKILAPRGSIVIWTGHVWHRSGANDSNAARTALLACFSASFLREVAVEENYLEVMSKENIETSSTVLKNMLAVGHGIKRGAEIITPF